MTKDFEKIGKEGEKFVHDLATNSFLYYWCYPNPIDESGDKKELCDLIIHFKNTLILVCVKNYEFKGFYKRYFQKAIEKDVRQLYGAERKIRNSKSGILIKNIDSRGHVLKKNEIDTIYRIIIHLGDKVHFYPFNRTTKSVGFVNVFDKNSFINIVRYLDTIKDFEEYLQSREEAFGDKEVLIMPSEEHEFDSETEKQFFQHTMEKMRQKRQILISGTESDLLANYIQNQRRFSKHIFSEEYKVMLFQIDGKWNEFLNMKQVQEKFKEDRVSYFIDEFVKREILINPTDTNIEFAKELLSFNRFDRRVISKNLFEFVKTHEHQRGFYIARRYGEIDGVAIIFIFYTFDMTEEQVNTMLPMVMDTYAYHKNYKYKKMILIATTTECKQFKVGMELDIQPFDQATEEMMKKNIETLGWFQNTTETYFSEKEFPD